jgi:alpha/beta superfamily hydrolase
LRLAGNGLPGNGRDGMLELPRQRKLTFDGPAGVLEGLLELPKDREPTACAVICHPHPLHGGTMQNKVAHTLARSFAGVDFAALRFNFRGVGASVGNFDDGNGELQDVLAAVNWLHREFPDLPLWLAGFSFGAAMAIRATASCQPAGLVSVAPAVSRFADNLDRQPTCPWLIVQGDQDELVAVQDTINWVNGLDPGPELTIFPGTEHFFHGKLTDLRETVQNFVRDNRGDVETQ